ncbi:hypothetical protein LINGRAHAP2_LOCUS6148 [Linum grandiflorum]
MVAEAYAIQGATKLAITSGLPSRIFSEAIIEAISGPKHRWPWKCFGTLGAIEAAHMGASSMTFHFIPRSLNSRADRIAKMARSYLLLPGWITSFVVNGSPA